MGTRLQRKTLAILATLAALTGSAMAADLAPRYSKAPEPVAVAPSWTGFYIFGGVGEWLWDANTSEFTTATRIALSALTTNRVATAGLVRSGAGYDWQFNGRWVAGILADSQTLITSKEANP